MEVMLCLLPESVNGDVSLHIHFTLLEAFCWENDIRVIKVDNVHKLGVAMQSGDDSEVAEQRKLSAQDYSCVLIEVRI